MPLDAVKPNIKPKKLVKKINKTLLTTPLKNELWVSVSEAAKLGGVQTKTIRRAIDAKLVNFKIISNRYLITLTSVILYLNTKTKLKNKLNECGIGQYIKDWIE